MAMQLVAPVTRIFELSAMKLHVKDHKILLSLSSPELKFMPMPEVQDSWKSAKKATFCYEASC